MKLVIICIKSRKRTLQIRYKRWYNVIDTNYPLTINFKESKLGILQQMSKMKKILHRTIDKKFP
jgi:hypothetical protein